MASIALAVGLAFLFGYGLTSLPLLRARLALTANRLGPCGMGAVDIANPF